MDGLYNLLKNNPSAIAFEIACREMYLKGALSAGFLSCNIYYGFSLLFEFRDLFYTECTNIITFTDSDLSAYDINNTTYSYTKQLSNSDIIDSTDKIKEKYPDLAMDEIICLDSRSHNLLVFGYIHENNWYRLRKDWPSIILYLILEYSKFINWKSIPNQYDLINFITSDDTKYAELYRRKGNEYFKLKQYNSAIIKYNKALFYNTDNHFVYNNLALCYSKLSQHQNSKMNAWRAIENDPSFIKAWVRLAMSAQKLDEYEISTISILVAYCITYKFDADKCKYGAMKRSKLEDSNILNKLYLKNEALINDNISYQGQQALDNNLYLFFESDRYKDEVIWFQTVIENIIDSDKNMQ